jgi:hypothetical protein
MGKPSKGISVRPKNRKEVLDALGAYQRKGAFSDPESLAKTYKNETDRGLVVVLGSMTEDFLLTRIVDQFSPISNTLLKDLTRSGGALGTWAQQTNVALAMGIIDDSDANDLEVFKTMRNACAHSRQPIDFNTPELRDALGLLLKPSIATLPQNEEWRSVFRQMLVHVVAYLWGRITEQCPKRSGVERFEDFRARLQSKRLPPWPQKPRRRRSPTSNRDRK